MKNIIAAAIDSLGTDITIKGKSGRAVICSKRYAENFSGGTVRNHNGLSDPHRAFIYAGRDLFKGASRGDIVRSGTNEYYILWVDEVDSKFGGYSKACIRKCEEAEE